tara:strand:+ start:2262 stop:2525 length:264 start_codon:yes stop_codon:yes gene_type:complete
MVWRADGNEKEFVDVLGFRLLKTLIESILEAPRIVCVADGELYNQGKSLVVFKSFKKSKKNKNLQLFSSSREIKKSLKYTLFCCKGA